MLIYKLRLINFYFIVLYFLYEKYIYYFDNFFKNYLVLIVIWYKLNCILILLFLKEDRKFGMLFLIDFVILWFFDEISFNKILFGSVFFFIICM